jgi:glycosidase
MRNPKVQEEMKRILKFWLHTKNIDGIRIDAIKHLFEDSSLKNEPKNKNATSVDPTVSNIINY